MGSFLGLGSLGSLGLASLGAASRKAKKHTKASKTSSSVVALAAEGEAGEAEVASGGQDFSKLKSLLEAQDFKAADAETRSLLIKMCGAEAQKRGWVYFAEVKTIPEEDMDTLEKLWQEHSNGRFGFVQQRKIWRKNRGQFDKFAEEVSWFTDTWKNRNWPDEFIYSLEAPVGHLPLTNCIRGAQVLEELLSHPAIQNQKAKKPKPVSKASDDQGGAGGDKPRRSALSMLASGRTTKTPSRATLAGHF